MKTFQRQFYATRPDLLPGLQRLESEVKLQYVLRGMFPSPTPTVFFSALDIPDLGVARYGDYSHEQEWLVMEEGAEITAEEVPQAKGGVLYDIGLENRTAFAFEPAGQFGEKTIIVGSVGTATGDPTSLARCSWFWRGLSKEFKKVKGYYYVGPEAYRLLEHGWRLTLATQCPPDLDLRI
jgi:hypothetical protein